jgi:hypothetical protein
MTPSSSKLDIDRAIATWTKPSGKGGTPSCSTLLVVPPQPLFSLSPPENSLKNPLRFGRTVFDEAVATDPDGGGAAGFDEGEEGGRAGRGGDSPTMCPPNPGALSAAADALRAEPLCKFP